MLSKQFSLIKKKFFAVIITKIYTQHVSEAVRMNFLMYDRFLWSLKEHEELTHKFNIVVIWQPHKNGKKLIEWRKKIWAEKLSSRLRQISQLDMLVGWGYEYVHLNLFTLSDFLLLFILSTLFIVFESKLFFKKAINCALILSIFHLLTSNSSTSSRKFLLYFLMKFLINSVSLFFHLLISSIEESTQHMEIECELTHLIFMANNCMMMRGNTRNQIGWTGFPH